MSDKSIAQIEEYYSSRVFDLAQEFTSENQMTIEEALHYIAILSDEHLEGLREIGKELALEGIIEEEEDLN